MSTKLYVFRGDQAPNIVPSLLAALYSRYQETLGRNMAGTVAVKSKETLGNGRRYSKVGIPAFQIPIERWLNVS